MDFCRIILGKSLNHLSYQDIEKYFSEEKIETNQIEFKSINPNGEIEKKITTLVETICAFLNSDGGILIWGAPAGKSKEGFKEKSFFGNLTPTHHRIEKDAFINKISSKITPLPSAINLEILNKEDSLVYIFEIQQSEYSPHQTNNHYYMRIDGQTRVAPHHYIEALFKKIKYPNIEGYLRFDSVVTLPNIQIKERTGKYFELNFSILIFNWSPLQNEENVYARIISDWGIFSECTSVYGPRNLEYSEDGQELAARVSNLLAYGEPLIRQETLYFNYEERQ